MKIELSDKECNLILECINVAIKTSDNAIQSSAVLLPIVAKLNAKEQLAEDEPTQ